MALPAASTRRDGAALHAGIAGAHRGVVARRALAAGPRLPAAVASRQRARKSRPRSGRRVLRRSLLPETAGCPRAARDGADARTIREPGLRPGDAPVPRMHL